MTINDRLMRLGRWELNLRGAPQDVRDALEYFGHVAVTPAPMDPRLHGDDLLDHARYVGVLRGRKATGETLALDGVGMAVWLGDEDGKGEVYETAKTFDAATFAATIRGLLPASVLEGTLYSVAGTYTGEHVWESPRSAIDYVCDTFGAEWRVNGDGTLDAGEADNLYPTVPTAIIVRKGAGRDMDLRAVTGDAETEEDVKDWSDRVVLLAEGEGDAIATGSADAQSNPYTDLHGNPVKRTRLVNESETSSGNAGTRAQLHLNRFSGSRRALRLSTREYDLEGEVQPGHKVYVYDPDAGLVDESNPVRFRGQLVYPIVLRVHGLTFPVRDGMGVYYRAGDGSWTDLTPYLDTEDGATELEVGAHSRSLTGGSDPGRVADRTKGTTDPTTPGAPTLGTITTGSYEDDRGRSRAWLDIPWSRPLNTDGSTITDGDRYEVRWRRSGEAEWSYTALGWSAVSIRLEELVPGATYEVGVRAVDTSGKAGAWATDTAVASADTTAPSAPTAPTVATGPLSLMVTHDLTRASDGLSLERDLDHLEVHASTTTGFTPSATTLLGKIAANAGHIDGGVEVLGTFQVTDEATRYVKVKAVDRSGNKSAASAQATGSATLIDTQYVRDLHAQDITAGTISASRISIGGGTTYESGYDPTTKEPTVVRSTTAPADTSALWLDTSVTPNVWKQYNGTSWVKATPTAASEVGAETPSGAQSKADTAETNAKGYTDTEVATREPARHESTTAPTDTSVLWIDTSVTPNVVKRHNGTSWVKATPTDAAEVGAETPAGAQSKADTAETNANGYTEVYAQKDVTKSATAPTSPVDGDLWLETDTLPEVLYRWDAGTTQWRKATPTAASEVGAETPSGAQSKADTAEANAKSHADTGDSGIRTDFGHPNDVTLIDGGSIYTGSIQTYALAAEAITADKIGAGEIHTDHMVVGSFDNLIPDPGFEFSDDTTNTFTPGWYLTTSGPSDSWVIQHHPTTVDDNHRDGAQNAYYEFTNSRNPSYDYLLGGAINGGNINSGIEPGRIEASEGDEFYVEAWCGSRGNGYVGSGVQAFIQFRDSDGGSLGSYTSSYVRPGNAGTGLPDKVSHSATAPKGTAYVLLGIRIASDVAGDPNTTGSAAFCFDSFYARKKVGGDLLVAGDIWVGGKVEAGNVALGQEVITGWNGLNLDTTDASNGNVLIHNGTDTLLRLAGPGGELLEFDTRGPHLKIENASIKTASSGRRVEINTGSWNNEIALYTGHASEGTPPHITSDAASFVLSLAGPNVSGGVSQPRINLHAGHTDATWPGDITFSARTATDHVRVTNGVLASDEIVGHSGGGPDFPQGWAVNEAKVDGTKGVTVYGGGASTLAAYLDLWTWYNDYRGTGMRHRNNDTGAAYEWFTGVPYAASHTRWQVGSGAGGDPVRQGQAELLIHRGSSGFEMSRNFTAMADNWSSLGTGTYRWKDVWAVDSTINTSDPSRKRDVRDLPDKLGLPFLRALRPTAYKWVDGKRDHAGLLADDVRDRLAERGVDLGVFVDPSVEADQMEAEGPRPQEEGESDGAYQLYLDERQERIDGLRAAPLGLRYTEVIPMLVRSIQQLAERVEALEAS